MSVKVKTRARALATTKPPASTNDLDLARMVLRDRNRRLSARLDRVATAVTLEQTLDGSSTLSIVVRDEDNRLLRSQLVKGRSTLVLDAVEFRLVKVSRADAELTLTFEETAANVLRSFSRPRKANRMNTTRAQFVRVLVREPKSITIPFRCPELNVRQPIAG